MVHSQASSAFFSCRRAVFRFRLAWVVIMLVERTYSWFESWITGSLSLYCLPPVVDRYHYERWKKKGRFSKEILIKTIRSHPLGNLVPLAPFPSDIPYATLCSLSILIRTKFLLQNPAPNDPTFSRPMLHLNEIQKEGPTERTTGRWTGVGPRFFPPNTVTAPSLQAEIEFNCHISAIFWPSPSIRLVSLSPNLSPPVWILRSLLVRGTYRLLPFGGLDGLGSRERVRSRISASLSG